MSVQASQRLKFAFRTIRPQHSLVARPVAFGGMRLRQIGERASSALTTDAPTDQQAPLPLSDAQRAFLDRALRVNQAGELAAVLIYRSQIPPITKAHPKLRLLMKHMLEQEEGHLHKFNHLIVKHRVRPTAMQPIWKAAATVLGWGTGVMGRPAAMACTEAVETVIGAHYNQQVATLLEWERQSNANHRRLNPELRILLQDLRRIRDEELDHLDCAVQHDAKQARPYELLTGIIRGGCRAAIWVSERV